MHGRELLTQGLVRKIGNGTSSNVWGEKWIIDIIPRPPMYKENITTNLALNVSDLLIQGTSMWNLNLLFQTFTPEDVERIMMIRPCVNQEDSIRWGFTKRGDYPTQSCYKLLEALVDFEHPQTRALPLIERQLWRNIWKIKAPPKIKHFIWRALSGALAVKERLITRGIQMDTTCLCCNQAAESICHVLFGCDKAHEVWELANVPFPTSGFSRNSVFLNFVHLLKVSDSKAGEPTWRNVFPWLVWELWKARNALAFENKSLSAHTIAAKAFEEAYSWQNTLNLTENSGGLHEEGE